MPPFFSVVTRPEPQGAKPCVLDLSRSFSRAGRPVATGIDRVERAYWAELAQRDRPFWAIVRTGKDYALLDRNAAGGLMRRLAREWPAERIVARYAPDMPRRLRRLRAVRYLRRRATWFGSMAGLMVLLRARFGQGFEYLNVGHGNLDDIFLRQIRAAGAAPVRIKLHDMIPLDFPDLVRADTPALFQARARAALAHADQIICNSAHTADRVRHHAAAEGVWPDCLIAHLGVAVPQLACRRAQEPYFICLGTIEPRKNHAFLFEIWQRLADQGGPVPKLLIIGARGWRNDDVFRLLDTSPLMGRYITEHAGMNDAEVFGVLSGAAALLFPSHEEGFGLPALEARALGVPVICSQIPVFRELLRGDATLLPTDDPQRWADAVLSRMRTHRAQMAMRRKPASASAVPTWQQHFEIVFGPHPARAGHAAQGALTSVRTV